MYITYREQVMYVFENILDQTFQHLYWGDEDTPMIEFTEFEKCEYFVMYEF